MEISTKQQKIDLLEAVFGESSLSNSGKNISVRCPVCERNSKASPKKKKLSICLEKGIYHCWVCETKGKNIASFSSREANIDNSLKFKISAAFNLENLVSQSIEEKILMLPHDFTLLYLDNTRSGKIAKRYLHKRGLIPDDLLTYKVGISSQNEFINRIIFPSYDDDMRLNFYLTRTYDEKDVRKYKNCDAKKSEIIFSESTINWKEEIVLVEGVFDAIKAGKNAAPVLGSWIDEKHKIFRKIVEEKTDVVLAFDPDAISKTRKIARKFAEYGIKVRITQNKDKDIGDMSKEEANICIQSAKKYELSNRIEYLIKDIYTGSIF